MRNYVEMRKVYYTVIVSQENNHVVIRMCRLGRAFKYGFQYLEYKYVVDNWKKF